MQPHRPARPFQALLATDLSTETLPHVAFGARLIERLGGRTTLFHAALQRPMATGESLPGIVAAPDVDEAALRDRLREIASTLVVDHPVKTDLALAASAREAILAAIRAHDATMLALPSHGRSGAGRALLGSVAEDVVRHARVPTLLLTEHMVHEGAVERGRFVLATSAGDEDVAALQPAADIARRLDLPLLLMSVLPATEPPPYGGGAPVAPSPTPAQDRLRERLRALRTTAAALGGDLHAEVHACIDDDPVKAIVARAEEGDVALVVLGTHARTGVARLFRGSVAEEAARRSRTPVVIVPPAS